MKDVLMGLNIHQQEAVKAVSGPSVILAGAGSGKTRVLIHKVLHLIQNHAIPPSEIVMITFTNKAAKEMKHRIEVATEKKMTLGYVGTFHSFCAYILRRDGEHIGIPRTFVIYDAQDSQDLMRQILKKTEGQKYSPSYFLSRISEAKNQLISPEKFLEVFSYYKAATIAEIYYSYQNELKKNNAIDFDDLISRACELFRTCPEILAKYQDRYRYWFVDEFQDTNFAQYSLVKYLAGRDRNITVVGDFSQSIYSWRGADITNLSKFESDFPQTTTYKLEENYRCTQEILDLAYNVIRVNETHPILELYTKNSKGDEIVYYEADNEEEESRYIANQIQTIYTDGATYEDIAVLYRTNAQSRVIEEMFLHLSIPYTLIGGTRFYERREIKDLLSYLRLILHPDDSVAIERIQKLGKRRWTKFKSVYSDVHKSLQDYPTADILEKIFHDVGYLEMYDPDNPEDYARLENMKELKSVALTFPDLPLFLEQVALVESEYFEGEKNNKSGQGVRLMTLHQAKGLEFEYVFITGLEEGILPHSRSIDEPKSLEEERRLFYVGITRAKQRLTITHAKRRFIFGRRTISVKSRFISDGSDEITYEDDIVEW